MLRRVDGATIRRLIAALPEPFREAVVLRDINDLSYREIAEVVGVPVGTVMSRLARARSMLRAAGTSKKDRRHELLRSRSLDQCADRRRA